MQNEPIDRAIRISKRTVDALQPTDRRCIWWDTTIRGFGVEVLPSGNKVFRLKYRSNGLQRLLTIGAMGNIAPDEARKIAERMRGAIAHGRDPAKEKLEARDAETFAAAFDEWMREHIEPKRKPTTVENYRRVADAHFLNARSKSSLRNRRLVEIQRADVAALHRRLAATPYVANYCVAVLRSFFNWCERHHRRPENSNPARLIELFPERSRECTLSPAELARLGAALRDAEAKGEWPWALGAILLIAFTGARKREILGLKWDWIDLEAGTARLPDSKTGAKTLHFPAAARAVLHQLAARRGVSHNIIRGKATTDARVRKCLPVLDLALNPFVCCGRLQDRPLENVKGTWERIRTAAGLPDLRIHDLRHVFASTAASSGMPLLTIGKLLGHSQPSVTDRYAHLASGALHTAAEDIAGLLARHMGRQDSSDRSAGLRVKRVRRIALSRPRVSTT